MNFLSNWLAKITKKGSEELSLPIQQFEMNGRVGDAYIVSPYGVHANLPVNQPALNVSPDGTILMGIDPIGRIKVESGEVVFYHPITKSKIHFKNNHDIDVETEADINAQCKNLNVIASEDINATCDNINVTAATKATVTAPDIALIGNVAITGDLSVSGSTALSATVTSNGKDISDSHGHTQGPDSAADTQQNTGGVV